MFVRDDNEPDLVRILDYPTPSLFIISILILVHT